MQGPIAKIYSWYWEILAFNVESQFIYKDIVTAIQCNYYFVFIHFIFNIILSLELFIHKSRYISLKVAFMYNDKEQDYAEKYIFGVYNKAFIDLLIDSVSLGYLCRIWNGPPS